MINRNSIDDVSTVYIDFVGISGKAETILESREIPSSLGICVQDESIYCYMSSLNKDEKAEESFIREYSLKGEFKNEYPFNIDDFLKLEEVEDTDSVFKIVKANDYYVFKTDNNRNCILKQKRNKLEIAKIPEPLSSFGDGGVMILDHYSRYSDYVYFRQLTSNEIYIFDSQKSSFSLISFIDENDEISGITRDSTGNIIVEVQSGEHEYNYYYVSVSELIK